MAVVGKHNSHHKGIGRHAERDRLDASQVANHDRIEPIEVQHIVHQLGAAHVGVDD
jgi:hypothetical protein